MKFTEEFPEFKFKYLITVGILAFNIGFAGEAQQVLPSGPIPDSAERHDKYKDDPHAYCMSGKPEADNHSAHECHCSRMCSVENDGTDRWHEDSKCELYCTASRCLCHVDETCPMPEHNHGLPQTEDANPFGDLIK